MPSRMQRWSLAAGVAGLGCTLAGALAGVDAGRHIDRFYTTPPLPHYRSPVVVTESQGWDGSTSATYAAAPVYERLPVSAPARDELALYDERIAAPVDIETPPVRIHRASVVTIEPPPLADPAEGPRDPAEAGQGQPSDPTDAAPADPQP